MKYTCLFLASSIALVSHAQVQDSVCSKDLAGASQDDLDKIKHCQTYTGTITVANTPAQSLVLNGIESITGDLVVSESSSLGRFSAPQLSIVTGDVRFSQQLAIEKLELPALTRVGGSLTLSVLPMLETIDFSAGLTKADNLLIDDTSAVTIGGLAMETIATLSLAQNTRMKRFQLPVKAVTGSLLVIGNGQELEFETPNVVDIQAAEFRELGRLNAPLLSHVAGDLAFLQNNFASLSLDSLEDVGGTMTIANNKRLTETSFRKLNQIAGALSIGNNTELTAISGFQSLTSVRGMVDLAGRFDTYEIPQLHDVRGGMNIQTESTQFSCTQAEQKLKYSSIVKGNVWSCKTTTSSTQDGIIDHATTSTDSDGNLLQLPSSSNNGGESNTGGGANLLSPKKQNGPAPSAGDLAASASSATAPLYAHIAVAMLGIIAMGAGI